MFDFQNKRGKCLVGCLIYIIVSIFILIILIGVSYYFLSRIKNSEPGNYFQVDEEAGPVEECGDSLSCIDKNLKECSRADGETDLGDFAKADFKIMGKNGSSCVVFAEISEIKKLPEGTIPIPKLILDSAFVGLSMECLVPIESYTQGIEIVGSYIGDNFTTICKGPILDMTERFGIDLTIFSGNDINK